MKKFLQKIFNPKSAAIAVGLSAVVSFAGIATASHSWGGYHWARTANPFSIKLGNNLSGAWPGHLSVASADWSASTVLDTNIVPGQSNPKNCKPKLGRVETCNSKYGNNGWLGIAQIWISGTHIVQGTVRLNDTYYNTSRYNTPAWRQYVMCQEVGHTFGLDHQDENNTNTNLGTCMDYTNDPAGTAGTNGTLSNEHPNSHDYDQLIAIYTHLDSTNTSFSSTVGKGAKDDISAEDRTEWGKTIRKSKEGRDSLFERDLGKGDKVYTFVVWADENVKIK